MHPPSRHEVIEGRVLKISGADVFIDVGYKSDGVAPLAHFADASGNVTVRAGDVVEVMVDSGQNSEGYVVLSHEKAARLKIWDTIEKALEEQLTISGRVLGRVKGGLSIDVGVRAFMPGSQVDVRPIRNVEQFVGQDIPVKIVKVNRKRGNVVVSRKLAVQEEVEARKTVTIGNAAGRFGPYRHGEESYRIRCVHRSRRHRWPSPCHRYLLRTCDSPRRSAARGRRNPRAGSEIRSCERTRFARDEAAAWPIPGRAPRNATRWTTRVVGRVVSVTDYGAFVELEPGVEGLIHISEMTWSRRMKHPSKVVKPGDSVESVVLEVNVKDRRISLGLKQLEPNPWTTVEQRYSVGSVVEGRVRNMTEFGAFIEIEEGIDGLVHISDLSWTKRVKHPSEILRKGSVVQAVILAIDAPHKRLSLGIKQLQPDAWETWFQQHHVNDTVHGKVLRLAGFGAFVELAEGVEGLCHFSEVPGWYGPQVRSRAADAGRRDGFQGDPDERGGAEDRTQPQGRRPTPKTGPAWTNIRNGPPPPVPGLKTCRPGGTQMSLAGSAPDCKNVLVRAIL